MTQVLNKAISTNRMIAELHGKEKGPTVVFFGGIHGNEAAGVIAIEESLNNLQEDIKGSIYGIAGNLKALNVSRRYIDKDLNRLWTFEKIYSSEDNMDCVEDKEQEELIHLIEKILSQSQPPFYFIDFHTTSSKSIPFITINDAIINRKFSELFPIPTVLGIEEYLDGPLLSFINQLGYVSLGVEVGQHEDIESIQNAKAIINIILNKTGIANVDITASLDLLNNHGRYNSEFFEVTHREQIKPSDEFIMYDGFFNFQPILKNDLLAIKNGKSLYSPKDGRIFMPLYQKQGDEGFFIIEKINPLFLRVSAFFRKLKLYNLLVILPGVKWKNKKRGILEANLKVTKFFVKNISHLIGFRAKKIEKNRMLMYNREKVARTNEYKKEEWFNKGY